METERKSPQKIRLDLLRLFAAVGVILIHITGTETGSDIALDSLARFSVPVFVLISGYLVLPKADSFRYILRKIGRILFLMLLWSLVYYLYYLSKGLIPYTGPEGLVRYLVTEPMYFWYFCMTIGLYLFAPAFKVFADHADQRTFRYVLGLCFFFGSLVTIFVKTGYSATFNAVLERTKIAYGLGFPLLFLTGGYVSRFGIEKRNRYILYGSAVLAELAAILWDMAQLKGNAYTGLLSSFYAPNAILMGTAVFTMVLYFPEKKERAGSKAPEVIHYLSSLTLGIFVLHPLVMDYFKGVAFLNEKPVLNFAAILLVSTLIAMGIKAVPGIRKCI